MATVIAVAVNRSPVEYPVNPRASTALFCLTDATYDDVCAQSDPAVTSIQTNRFISSC
jgi:hypothetical protein